MESFLLELFKKLAKLVIIYVEVDEFLLNIQIQNNIIFFTFVVEYFSKQDILDLIKLPNDHWRFKGHFSIWAKLRTRNINF